MGLEFNKTQVLGEAEKFVAQGKIPAAIEEYRRVLEKNPRDLMILNTVADLYLRSGQTEEAIRRFYELAEKCREARMVSRAIAVYKRITKLAPDSVQALLGLGDLFAVQGLMRDAREHYMEVVEFYTRSNDKEKAQEVFEKVLALDRENPQLQLRLAELYAKKGKKGEGKKEEVIALYMGAAERFIDKNQPAEAEAALQVISRLDPENAELPALLGRAQMERGEFRQAVETLLAAPSRDTQKDILNLLFHSYTGLGDMANAKKIAQQLFESHGDFAALAQISGDLISQREWNEAMEIYEAAFPELAAQNSSAFLFDGLQEILASYPYHTAALKLILKVYEATGKVEEAKEISDRLARPPGAQPSEPLMAREIHAEPARIQPEVIEPEAREYPMAPVQPESQMGAGTASVEAPRPSVMAASRPPAPPPEESTTAQFLPSLEDQLVKHSLSGSELFVTYGQIGKAIDVLENGLKQVPGSIVLLEHLLALYDRSMEYRKAAECCKALAEASVKLGDRERAAYYGQSILRYQLKPQVDEWQSIETTPAQPAAPAPSATEAVSSLASPREDETQSRVEAAQVSSGAEVSEPTEEEDRAVEEIEFYLQAGMVSEAAEALVLFEKRSPSHSSIPYLQERLGGERPKEIPAAASVAPETAPSIDYETGIGESIADDFPQVSVEEPELVAETRQPESPPFPFITEQEPPAAAASPQHEEQIPVWDTDVSITESKEREPAFEFFLDKIGAKPRPRATPISFPEPPHVPEHGVNVPEHASAEGPVVFPSEDLSRVSERAEAPVLNEPPDTVLSDFLRESAFQAEREEPHYPPDEMQHERPGQTQGAEHGDIFSQMHAPAESEAETVFPVESVSQISSEELRRELYEDPSLLPNAVLSEIDLSPASSELLSEIESEPAIPASADEPSIVFSEMMGLAPSETVEHLEKEVPEEVPGEIEEPAAFPGEQARSLHGEEPSIAQAEEPKHDWSEVPSEREISTASSEFAAPIQNEVERDVPTHVSEKNQGIILSEMTEQDLSHALQYVAREVLGASRTAGTEPVPETTSESTEAVSHIPSEEPVQTRYRESSLAASEMTTAAPREEPSAKPPGAAPAVPRKEREAVKSENEFSELQSLFGGLTYQSVVARKAAKKAQIEKASLPEENPFLRKSLSQIWEEAVSPVEVEEPSPISSEVQSAEPGEQPSERSSSGPGEGSSFINELETRPVLSESLSRVWEEAVGPVQSEEPSEEQIEESSVASPEMESEESEQYPYEKAAVVPDESSSGVAGQEPGTVIGERVWEEESVRLHGEEPSPVAHEIESEAPGEAASPEPGTISSAPLHAGVAEESSEGFQVDFHAQTPGDFATGEPDITSAEAPSETASDALRSVQREEPEETRPESSLFLRDVPSQESSYVPHEVHEEDTSSVSSEWMRTIPSEVPREESERSSLEEPGPITSEIPGGDLRDLFGERSGTVLPEVPGSEEWRVDRSGDESPEIAPFASEPPSEVTDYSSTEFSIQVPDEELTDEEPRRISSDIPGQGAGSVSNEMATGVGDKQPFSASAAAWNSFRGESESSGRDREEGSDLFPIEVSGEDLSQVSPQGPSVQRDESVSSSSNELPGEEWVAIPGLDETPQAESDAGKDMGEPPYGSNEISNKRPEHGEGISGVAAERRNEPRTSVWSEAARQILTEEPGAVSGKDSSSVSGHLPPAGQTANASCPECESTAILPMALEKELPPWLDYFRRALHIPIQLYCLRCGYRWRG